MSGPRPRFSGAMIVRNGIRYGYPFREAIRSLLPLVDECIVGVGQSDDGTRAAVAGLNDARVRILDTQWDDSSHQGGTVLSVQTNRVLDACSREWIFCLQADEVVHENDLERIAAAARRASRDLSIDGLFFDYSHFYGSYQVVQTGRNWYNREVRVIRAGRGIVSHGDAQGFRRNGRLLCAAPAGARIYHYGWVRPPETMRDKVRAFHRFWHDDAWIQRTCAERDAASYFSDLGNLGPFHGTHPAVMADLVAQGSTGFIEACRSAYFRRRGLSGWIRDIVRALPLGRPRYFTPKRPQGGSA